MNTITIILIVFVALEHLYFIILEFFFDQT